MQDGAIITTQDTTLRFSHDAGVFDLSFSVTAGSIFGLIGPSGCGKTTTMRLLTGLYKPDRGSISVLGQMPHRFTAEARERIGYMPQRFVLYPTLTVWENLRFAASLYGMGYTSRRKRLEEMLAFVELTSARKRRASKLSGGMQRRLELACALVHNPSLLFTDEPTAGIDPVLRGKFWGYFRALRDQGHTLFVTTQYIAEAAYCDVVGVMRKGRLLYIETPERLRRQAQGGEIIKLAVTPHRASEAARVVSQHPMVKLIRGAPEDPGLLYVHVDDAGSSIAPLVTAFNQQTDIAIYQIEEYRMPLDDIFITLMQRAEGRYG